MLCNRRLLSSTTQLSVAGMLCYLANGFRFGELCNISLLPFSEMPIPSGSGQSGVFQEVPPLTLDLFVNQGDSLP